MGICAVLWEDRGAEAFALPVESVMTLSPRVIAPDRLAAEAVLLMEQHEVSVLVVAEESRPVGMVHLHDLLKAGVAREDHVRRRALPHGGLPGDIFCSTPGSEKNMPRVLTNVGGIYDEELKALGKRGPLWVHGVSVGEVQSAASLVEAMGEELPGPLLFSTITPTGRQMGEILLGFPGGPILLLSLGSSPNRSGRGECSQSTDVYYPGNRSMALSSGRTSGKKHPRLSREWSFFSSYPGPGKTVEAVLRPDP